MKRLYNLDYLRGISAFGIMIYHYLSWSVGTFSAESFLGRIGLYGVSLFYVLSGLTLYYVYYNVMSPSLKDILLFIKKRIFRIFPLLWLVTIISVIIVKKGINTYDLFLNLTGLFGFVKWEAYFSPGVWSIGNELVFYSFFPFFIYFSKHIKFLMLLVSLAILSIYVYFAFFKLDLSVSLGLQWKVYINPLNQVFLFLGGYLIGYFFSSINISNRVSILLIFMSLCLFTFFPSSADPIDIVVGGPRLIFTLSCFLICLGFYKISFKLPDSIHKFFALLGESSYSIYLLHPLVFTMVSFLLTFLDGYGFKVPVLFKLTVAISFSVVISYFVYEYFEKYFIRKASTKQLKPRDIG
ncbi:MAG: acyltransferase [Bacteroidota bacterium]